MTPGVRRTRSYTVTASRLIGLVAAFTHVVGVVVVEGGTAGWRMLGDKEASNNKGTTQAYSLTRACSQTQKQVQP